MAAHNVDVLSETPRNLKLFSSSLTHWAQNERFVSVYSKASVARSSLVLVCSWSVNRVEQLEVSRRLVCSRNKKTARKDTEAILHTQIPATGF